MHHQTPSPINEMAESQIVLTVGAIVSDYNAALNGFTGKKRFVFPVIVETTITLLAAASTGQLTHSFYLWLGLNIFLVVALSWLWNWDSPRNIYLNPKLAAWWSSLFGKLPLTLKHFHEEIWPLVHVRYEKRKATGVHERICIDEAVLDSIFYIITKDAGVWIPVPK
jgi:4-amino-4-deoxy-L-arabinose transferase-like glycosyltransferase